MTQLKPIYPIWPDVPVMFKDCKTLEQKIKHRIRRAAEKADDYAGNRYEQAEMTFDKLLAVTEIKELLEKEDK